MKYKINLIPKKEETLGERFLYFASHYLRYIIVITQLVVIAVFFYRFQIDQSIIDLKDGVDQKKEIIQIVLPLLNEAAKIDKKTVIIEKTIIEQKNFSTMLDYFIASFPETITLTNMEIESESIKVTGDANDAKHLQAF